MEANRTSGAGAPPGITGAPPAPEANDAATTPAPGTAGGGPAPASDQPAVLGTHVLNPPNGEVKEITLPDGSKLVPIARVLPNGETAPLTAAPFAGRGGAAAGGGAAPAPAPAAAPAAAPPTPTEAPEMPSGDPVHAATPESLPGVEPDGFMYNDNYYAKFHRAEAINLTDKDAVDRRLARSTIAYMQEEEPETGDFGVHDVKLRRATAADADLLRVNPRAYWIADVVGVTGTGQAKNVPVVMNGDGAVFVDPRARRI